MPAVELLGGLAADGQVEPDLIGPPARPEELLGLEDILLTADSLAFRDS